MADEGGLASDLLGDDLMFDDPLSETGAEDTAKLTLTDAQRAIVEQCFDAVGPNEEGEIPAVDVGKVCANIFDEGIPMQVLAIIEEMTEGLQHVDLHETTSIVAAALLKTAHWGALATPASGPVGFEAIDDQVRKKNRKRGYALNILVVGESGMGKSSFIDSLFRATVSRTSCDPGQAGLIPEATVKVQSVTHVLEEAGVNLKLTLTDTPGFGDQINNTDGIVPILNYIEAQYSCYLDAELAVRRLPHIPDTRVHACLYFIPPSGHGLRPLDLEVMAALHQQVNLIPVIAKADSMTVEERRAFKQRVREDLEQGGIRCYPPFSTEIEDEEEASFNDTLRDEFPFAVVSSNHEKTEGGEVVRGRNTRCGFVELENPEHCDFALLRDMLVRRNLYDLVEQTANVHYEQYRRRNLEVHGGLEEEEAGDA